VPRTGNKWDQRIDRARILAETYPFCTQILSFYSKLTAFQKSSYLEAQSACGSRNGRRGSLPNAWAEAPAGMPALDEVDLSLLLARWGSFLSMLASEAPASLAEFAHRLSALGPDTAIALLLSVWPGDRWAATEAGDAGATLVGTHTSTPQQRATTSVIATSISEYQSAQLPEVSLLERFCAQAFLQPYAELLADQAKVPTPAVRRPTCPYCGSPPLVGVLRQEGDGAKRSLLCSFCRTEWDYLRIACPACEESREQRLCVYTTPAFDCVRVEACDTCRAYIETVDLTRNGLAVPEVDELAAIPLALWADERGYKKVARNIIGL
jgi:formate dehydrogenase maturation protein FdhE